VARGLEGGVAAVVMGRKALSGGVTRCQEGGGVVGLGTPPCMGCRSGLLTVVGGRCGGSCRQESVCAWLVVDVYSVQCTVYSVQCIVYSV
jgi:hypothetical protein